MNETDVLSGLTNTGLAGMLFFMWWYQHRKEDGLQEIIKEQVEDKRIMREERAELVRMVREQTAQNTRIAEALQRVETFLKSDAQ